MLNWVCNHAGKVLWVRTANARIAPPASNEAMGPPAIKMIMRCLSRTVLLGTAATNPESLLFPIQPSRQRSVVR